jgi:hypothetical protein
MQDNKTMTRSQHQTSEFASQSPMCSVASVRATLVIATLAFITVTGPQPVLSAVLSVKSAPQSSTVTEVDVQVAVDRTTVEIADPFLLTVSVKVANGSKVQFPSTPKQLGQLGDFDIVSVKDQFDVPTQSGRLWQRVYELESFASGDLVIPSLSIIVNGETSNSSPIEIRVQSVLEEQADPFVFRDIKEPVEIPAEKPASQSWITRLIAGGAGLGCAALLLLVARRQTTVRADAWAYRKLSELKRSEDFSNGDQAKLLPEVADVLREYIRRRFGMAAPQLTTAEFLELAKSDHRLDGNQQMQLKFLLHQVDQIKFASFLPGGNQLETTFEQAHQFIEETTAQPGDRDAKIARTDSTASNANGLDEESIRENA